jgi:branched-chain amino acid transport system substrate-binding protein
MTSKPPKVTTPLPPIAYIAGLLLIGLGSRFLVPRFNHPNDSQRFVPEISVASSDPNHLPNRFSEGQFTFFPQDGTTHKAAAVAAYAQENYQAAQKDFERSLQQKRNDPESWIYANNAKAITTNPLKIAVSVPIGTDANGSREILRGVAQAQQEINTAGGIHGRAFMVVIANDDNDVKIAQDVAQQLVDRSDILGVVGHFASGVTLATADTYTQGRLTVISPISSAVQLSNKSPYVFRTVPSDFVAARALANYMLQQLHRKKVVVYFNSQSDYSKSLKGEFSRAIALQGGQVVGEYDLANSSFSANQSLEDALQKEAEVILLASNTSSLDRALQVVQANNNRLPMLAGDDVYAPKTLDVSQGKGQDLVLAVPWHSQGKKSRDFAQRSRQLWGGEVNWRTVTAYDATQALGAALAQEPTRAGIQQALRSPSFSASKSVRGISFLPSGDSNASVQLVKVAQGSRSGLGYDFVPLP